MRFPDSTRYTILEHLNRPRRRPDLGDSKSAKFAARHGKVPKTQNIQRALGGTSVTAQPLLASRGQPACYLTERFGEIC